ncbi:hypothetical protein [Pectobacterium betavasculorum]
MHHVKEISIGGEVYNLDTLQVVTPKHHVGIHKGEK